MPLHREVNDRRPNVQNAEILRSSLGTGEIDFSIVVPTYNRPLGLSHCLEAIASGAYPRSRYEVIVVDDGSEETLEPIVAPFLRSLNITLLRQRNSGPACARNAGAREAGGTYLVFLDDDCRPDPGWLHALGRKLDVNPLCAAGGKTVNGLAQNLFSTASQDLIEYLYNYWNPDADDAAFVTSNNLVFPRILFKQIGGFDTNFPFAAAEDRELCDRWRSLHQRIVYAPEALVFHYHELSLKTFLVQHFTYGRGAVIFHNIRKQRIRQRTEISQRAFFRGLLYFAVTRKPGLRGIAVGMLIWLSQIVMVFGYLSRRYLGY